MTNLHANGAETSMYLVFQCLASCPPLGRQARREFANPRSGAMAGSDGPGEAFRSGFVAQKAVEHRHKAGHARPLDDVRDLMDDCQDGIGVDVQWFGRRLDKCFNEHIRARAARLH